MTCTTRTLPDVGDHESLDVNAAVSADVAPVGDQMGLGPSPPPEPWSAINATVPKPARMRTITVVVTIHPAWTFMLPRAASPPTGSGPPFLALQVRMEEPKKSNTAIITCNAITTKRLKST